MAQRVLNRNGFTLVELMLVIAIVGLLAAIAIPNFLSFRMKAKTSEAKANLGQIRSLELAYFAEWELWVAGATNNPRPVAQLNGAKAAWDPATSFSILGFAPESHVYFTYNLLPAASLFAGKALGFTVQAVGDLDADALESVYYMNDRWDEVFHTGPGEF